jgi:DNA-binding winged helix-turn-helix (wHTH) protein
MPRQSLRQFGPYWFDPAHGQLWRHSQVIPLPPRALAVLGYLVAQAGQLVTKETLLAAGWPDTAVTEWVLTTCMRDLRHALGDDARQPQYIATVHRRGYRFMAEVTALAETALEAPDGGTVSLGPPEAAPSAVSSEPLGANALPGTVAPPAVEPESALAQATGPLPPSSALPSAPMAGTEHRHLTVLSCTFVDVERLTQQLDPEDS